MTADGPRLATGGVRPGPSRFCFPFNRGRKTSWSVILFLLVQPRMHYGAPFLAH
jgi:hypothetical protein